jgi:hypothetical protein
MFLVLVYDVYSAIAGSDRANGYFKNSFANEPVMMSLFRPAANLCVWAGL